MSERLTTPKTPFQAVVRELAIAAQEALYHDVDPSMPEWVHGVAGLEPIFTRILRGKLKASSRITDAGRAFLRSIEGGERG